jgi:GNAT superfamily N-acetyltransferase
MYERQSLVAPDPATAAREAESVRTATESEGPRVVEALARAFYDDPVLSWFFPDDSRRARQLEKFFALARERIWARHDLIYTTKAVAGAAVWLPPEEWRVGLLEQLRLTPSLISAIGLRDVPRALRGFNLMESRHPHEPHYYLPVVGVDPRWQGRGIGTALLRPMLERCDREGMPAYLEATSPRNRACYERNGFRVTDEFNFPNGPPLALMWREPGGA